jgi:ATP-dependent DNA helicase PIF1
MLVTVIAIFAGVGIVVSIKRATILRVCDSLARRLPGRTKRTAMAPLNIDNIKLTDEQQAIFCQIETTSTNLFITGKAGTGKSILLQYIRQFTSKKVIVVAPTGISALNIGAQTINSLFRLPATFIPTGSIKLDPEVAKLLRHIDAVVIDEASMVRADVLDAIDHLLRQAKNSQLPFGKVQILLFGDVFQLPPVVSNTELHNYFTDRHGGYYFFHAHAWAEAAFETHELSYIFRQKDENFVSLLNSVRTGNPSGTQLAELNLRYRFPLPEQHTITLATTNRAVAKLNELRLVSLPGKTYEFASTTLGRFEQGALPTEAKLKLKTGAQVMLLRNDRAKRWVNGTIGRIHSCKKNEVRVEINGRVYLITPETWQKTEYRYNPLDGSVTENFTSSFTQLPLKLAWAVTIHKAQGQTLGSVIIDLAEGAFAHGQTYVALSRCVSLSGVYLARPIRLKDIIVDKEVTSFMQKAMRSNGSPTVEHL